MSQYYKEVIEQYKEACDRYPITHPPMTALQIACAEVDRLRLALAASQDDAERERALDTRLIRNLPMKRLLPQTN